MRNCILLKIVRLKTFQLKLKRLDKAKHTSLS